MRPSVPNMFFLRPDAPVQVTPMEDEVVAEANGDVTDDTAVVAEATTNESESALVEKEVNLKREVKQQVREEPMQQEEGYYEVLTANEYLGIDPANVKSSLTFWCKCPLPPKGQSGCLAGCENRAKRVECDLPLCKAGDQCSNRVS
jgi:hypothetical protein